MNNKFNRIVATGLIALMIANFSACEQLSMSTSNGSDTTKDNGQISDVNSGFKGSIWDELSKGSDMYMGQCPYDNANEVSYLALPFTTLSEYNDFLYKDIWNKMAINDPEYFVNSDYFYPFKTRAFVDENSPNNDVYLLVNYQNKAEGDNSYYDNKDVYITTWLFKYTLSDDDYATFLKFNGDWRVRRFIQVMDKLYEPEIVSKATVAYPVIHQSSPYANREEYINTFPNIFIANVDYNNYSLKVGTVNDEGIKYIDVNMYESRAWKSAMEKYYNGDVEQGKASVEMLTTPTILGDCLTKFNVAGFVIGPGYREAQEMFNNSTDQQYLTEIDVNSTANIITSADMYGTSK